MLTELKDLDSSLAELLKEIDRQVAANVQDTSKFHANLISLIAKYPKDKELIEFVVFINDRLETTHNINYDIILESIKSLIKHKQTLLKKLMHDIERLESVKIPERENALIRILNAIKENKIILGIIFGALTVLFISISILIKPNETIKTIEGLQEIQKNMNLPGQVSEGKKNEKK